MGQASDNILRFFDSIQSSAAIVDEQGTIVDVNRHWVKFGRDNGWEHPEAGANYLEICGASGDELSDAIVGGIRDVLSGCATDFEQEYPCHSPSEKRWFKLRVAPFYGDEASAVIQHENVTAYYAALQDLPDRTAEFEQSAATVREYQQLIQSFERFAKVITGSLDTDEILDNLAWEIVTAGVFRSIMIALVDDDGVEVVRRRCWDGNRFEKGRIGVRYAIDDADVTARVGRTGQMEIISSGLDDSLDRRFDKPEEWEDKLAYFFPVKDPPRFFCPCVPPRPSGRR